MGKQMLWVLRTYLSSKLFLAVLAFVGLIAALIIVDSISSRTRFESNVPVAPHGKVRVFSVASLEDVRRRDMVNAVDDLDLARLWSDMVSLRRGSVNLSQTPPGSQLAVTNIPFELLQEFPNIHYLRMNVLTPRNGVETLVHPQRIRYLDVGALQDLTPLAAMRDLERLDFRWQESTAGIAALASLPKLKTLFVWSSALLDGAALAEIARLPQLECLVIQSDLGNPQVADAALARLQVAPRLRSLYLGPPWGPPRAEFLSQAQAMLPKVNLLPAVAPVRKPWFVGMAPTVLAFAVGGVLVRQFRNPASHLAPGFLLAHSLVATFWLALVATGGLLYAWSARQPISSGALFALGITGCMFGGGVDLGKRNCLGPTMKFSLLDQLLGLGMLMLTPLLILPVWWHISGTPQAAQDQLAPTNAVMITGVVILGAGYLGSACKSLRELAGAQSAVGNETARTAARYHANVAMLDSFRYENLVERWNFAPPRWTLWNRVLRWRVGNPRLKSLLLIVLGAAGAMALVSFLLPERQHNAPRLGVGMFPMFMLLIACVQIAFVWRRRITCLDVESLRPVSRCVLQRDLAASLAFDLLPPALTVGVIVTLSLHLRDAWFAAKAWQTLLDLWPEVLAMFVLVSGTLWLATLALASLLIVIERHWLGFVLGFTTFVLGGGAFAACLGLSSRTARGIEPGVVLPLLWMPTAVSAVVIACMWRLWTKIDFDRRS